MVRGHGGRSKSIKTMVREIVRYTNNPSNLRCVEVIPNRTKIPQHHGMGLKMFTMVSIFRILHAALGYLKIPSRQPLKLKSVYINLVNYK